MATSNPAGPDYYSNVRNDMLAMIDGKGLRILEVGCGTGSTLLAAKERGIASDIVGAEYVESVAAIAQKRGLKKIYTGDFSIAAGKIQSKERKFDAIIFGDVLEHMVDPWAALALAKNLLVDGGQVIASVPNFRYWRVMYNVFLRGNFRYEADGIMDKTHLRFFCRKNIIEMVNQNYQIIKIYGTMPKSGKIIRAMSLGLLSEFGTVQYVVHALKRQN